MGLCSSSDMADIPRRLSLYDNKTDWRTLSKKSDVKFMSIDFGTVFSSVAYWGEHDAQFLEQNKDSRILTYIEFSQDKQQFGKSVAKLSKERSATVLFGLKRIVGRIKSARRREALVFLIQGFRALDLDPKHRKAFNGVMFPVPACFKVEELSVLAAAAKQAEFNDVRFITDTSAAILNFVSYDLNNFPSIKKKQYLVLCLGAGFCSSGVVYVDYPVITVKSSMGGKFGAWNVTLFVMRELYREIKGRNSRPSEQKEYKMPAEFRRNTTYYHRCQQVMEVLAIGDDVKLTDDLDAMDMLSTTFGLLDNVELEMNSRLIRQFIESKTIPKIKKLVDISLMSANVALENIDEVLVGGQFSYAAPIKQWMAKEFGERVRELYEPSRYAAHGSAFITAFMDRKKPPVEGFDIIGDKYLK